MMLKKTLLSLAAVLSGCGAVAAPKAEVMHVGYPEKALVSTGMFTVYGQNRTRVMAVMKLCDDLMEDFYRILGQKPEKVGYVAISLFLYSEGDAPVGYPTSVKVRPLEAGGYRVDLMVDIRQRIDRAVLERGIVEAMMVERSLRGGLKVEEDAKMACWPWMIDGMLGAMRWNDEKMNRGDFVMLNQNPELFSIDRAMKLDTDAAMGLSGSQRVFYEVSSTVMVSALTRTAEGKEGMVAYLSEAARHEGEQSVLLGRHFPHMNLSQRSMEKLWSLQLANMAVPKLTETLSIEQTEKDLAELLHFRIMGMDGMARKVPFGHYEVLDGLQNVERSAAIQTVLTNLSRLSMRCFPEYREILASYAGFLKLMSERKLADDSGEMLHLLKQRRERLLKLHLRCRDVLDWYQISEAKDLKGNFRGYEQLLLDIESEKQRTKDEVIDPYMDQVEKLMRR